VRSGLITLEQLQAVPLFEQFRLQTLADHPQLGASQQGRRLLYESIRRMLSSQVYDVIAATQAALDAAQPADLEAVRSLPPLVQFGADMREQSKALKAFLLQHLYRHPQVAHTTGQAQVVVRELFAAYMATPTEMAERYQQRISQTHEEDAALPPHQVARTARVVADYIAGMTDRFALREHERITGQRLLA